MVGTAPSASAEGVRPRVGTVRAVINQASGSVGRGAHAQVSRALADHGYAADVALVAPEEVERALREAVDAAPDLLIVLAGDGTARLAGQMCGPDGPMLAPLAGGTMNMLPHALYGPGAWAAALDDMLAHGVERPISGGEVDGRAFYVAAILGAPALWASAREALRKGRLRVAWLRADRALRRAFGGRLRFALEDGERERAEALTLMCPLVSRGEGPPDALEASVLNLKGAAEAFRLGMRTVLPGGGWRTDPSVRIAPCREGRAWAKGRIPLVLDGEPHRLPSEAAFRFVPRALRVYAPPRSVDARPAAGLG